MFHDLIEGATCGLSVGVIRRQMPRSPSHGCGSEVHQSVDLQILNEPSALMHGIVSTAVKARKPLSLLIRRPPSRHLAPRELISDFGPL